MAIRLPLQKVLDYNDSGNVGATSIVTKTFKIPQDTDNIVVKLVKSSITGGGAAGVFLQTSDDGGTTWYDVAAMPAATGTIANAGASFISAPVAGIGVRSTSSPSASTATGTTQVSVLTVTGNASAFGLSANQITGLPIMGLLNRVAIRYTGTITTNDDLQVQVLVNSQANRA